MNGATSIRKHERMADYHESLKDQRDREHRQQQRKCLLAVLRPLIAAALLVTVAYLLGVEVHR